MAGTKISALPSATTPLTGTEVVPIVQSGATDKVTVANLTAGRDVSANSLSSGSYQLASSVIITDSTTARTLSASDNGKIIYCTNATGITVTTASTLTVGFSCVLLQGGTGQITIAAGAGTTLASYGGLVKSAGQYAVVNIVSPVTTTFIVAGQTT